MLTSCSSVYGHDRHHTLTTLSLLSIKVESDPEILLLIDPVFSLVGRDASNCKEWSGAYNIIIL